MGCFAPADFGVVIRSRKHSFQTCLLFHTPRQSTKREDAKDLKIIALEAKIQQKNEVVAEPLHEHVQLKKGFEDSKWMQGSP
jgi:hypothetical protein